VGERKALEIALLGERFSAQEAKDNNILNWVVPKDQLVAETEKMARKLADGPTFALGVAKKLIRNSFDNSWDEHSHREAEGLAACAATEDHFEGLSAFLEKRKAKFKGR
jgi:2-(1,2-epoxy-1,2-dihydrophenyl)acetyl-CoA isomerase